jgi:hypothetical protein
VRWKWGVERDEEARVTPQVFNYRH